MLVKLTTLGPFIEHPDLNAMDRLYKAGWVSFGHYRDNGAGVIDRYWDHPIWIEFATFRWHPDPAMISGGTFGIYAECFRWSLSFGTYADVLID